jgi:hypothetical protein
MNDLPTSEEPLVMGGSRKISRESYCALKKMSKLKFFCCPPESDKVAMMDMRFFLIIHFSRVYEIVNRDRMKVKESRKRFFFS